MIGICCPPELDIVYRQVEQLAKVNGVEVERVIWPATHFSGFLVSMWIDYDCPVSSRPPVKREEWAVFYLAKGLRRFQPVLMPHERTSDPNPHPTSIQPQKKKDLP